MVGLERYNTEEGWLCLDFANTLNWHASDHPEEEINDYGELLAWAAEKGIFPADEVRALTAEAARRPDAAQAVLAHAIELREAIYRIVVAVITGEPVAEGDMAILNAVLVETMPRARLVAGANGFEWGWEEAPGALDAMLGPIARSAADLLTSDKLDRVGQCADEGGCGWLFYDRSRNRSRRWCSMESCGNRAKARHHYERVRARGRAGD